MQIPLSRTQAGPSRKVKQGQEKNSRNRVVWLLEKCPKCPHKIKRCMGTFGDIFLAYRLVTKKIVIFSKCVHLMSPSFLFKIHFCIIVLASFWRTRTAFTSVSRDFRGHLSAISRAWTISGHSNKQIWSKRQRLGCVNPTSWLPLAAGGEYALRNLPF